MASPYPNLEKVKTVMKYRRAEKGKKPLSFAEIAKVMNSDVKSVYRWYQYGSGKKPMRIGNLSTDD